MNMISIIEKKRDGKTLTDNEIKWVIQSYVADQIPDYQMSSLLMAIFQQGMTFNESAWLTGAMLNSGERIRLNNIPGIKTDKHSTGGVGDKVSLILGPIVAALGVRVPMISGRALGHSGGTLDKLEAIPGFNTRLSIPEMKKEMAEIGISLIGQTDTLVPADKKIYALRDATGTVPSIPLVTASIMSKKIAEGAQRLVLDVKTGRGAFFKTQDMAEELAARLIAIGQKHNLPATALLTTMDQPLGYAVGNWLETREAIDTLQGKGPADLVEVTVALSSLMLLAAERVSSINEGIKLAEKAIQSGQAMEKFLEIVKWQGGDTTVVLNPALYPSAASSMEICSPSAGYVGEADALIIGQTSMQIGAGRLKKEDDINYTAGIVLRKKVGDTVQKGEVLAIAYGNTTGLLNAHKTQLQQAFKIVAKPPEVRPLILKIISGSGEQAWSAA